MIHEADYQGWTNWETWNVYVALDNEQESHNAMRKLVADGGTPQDLELSLSRHTSGLTTSRLSRKPMTTTVFHKKRGWTTDTKNC